MAARGDLLSSIRNFKKDTLAKAETDDRSAPVGVVDDPLRASDKPAAPAAASDPAARRAAIAEKLSRAMGGGGGEASSPRGAAPPVVPPLPISRIAVSDGAGAGGGSPVSQPGAPTSPAGAAAAAGPASGKGKAKKPKKHHKKKQQHAASPRGEELSSLAGRVSMVNDIEDVHSQRTAAGRPAPLLTLVFVLAALSSADLSVIVPSLSAYVTSLGGGVVSYGLILAAFNVGEVLATPLWSYWVDRRSVLVMLTLCVSLSACGGLMYFLADHSLVLMGVGRLVAGFGAANTVVAYSTITRVSRPDGERQFRMSLFTWMTRTMQVVGPGIGLVGVHLTGDSVGDVRVNEYNFAILVLIVAYGAFLLVALFFVVAAIHNSSFERLPRSLATDSDVQAGRLDLESGSLVNGRSLVLLLVYFVLIAAYWSFAAAVFPFGHDRLHWHLSRSYYFFIFLGCVFLAAFALLKLLHRCLDDFPLLVAALALSLCGSLALLRFGTAIGTAQVAVSGGLLVTGLCFGSVIVPSLVAEMAGLQVERLGSRMSWFFAITSLARTAGPLYGALLIRYGHLETIAIVGACMAALALIVLLTSSLRDSAHAGGPAAGAVDESARAALLDSAHMPAAEPKPAAPRRASTLRRGRYEPTKLRSVRGEVLTQDASTSV